MTITVKSMNYFEISEDSIQVMMAYITLTKCVGKPVAEIGIVLKFLTCIDSNLAVR